MDWNLHQHLQVQWRCGKGSNEVTLRSSPFWPPNLLPSVQLLRPQLTWNSWTFVFESTLWESQVLYPPNHHIPQKGKGRKKKFPCCSFWFPSTPTQCTKTCWTNQQASCAFTQRSPFKATRSLFGELPSLYSNSAAKRLLFHFFLVFLVRWSENI